MKSKRSNLPVLGELVSVVFSVAHACPKTKSAPDDCGDWTKFKLVEDDADLYVFECTRCQQAVCVEMETRVQRAAKKRVAR